MWVASIALSIAAHGLIFLMMAWSITNAVFAGGTGLTGGGEPVITVALVGRLGGDTDGRAPESAANSQLSTQLDLFLRQIRSAEPAEPAAESQPHNSLNQILDQMAASGRGDGRDNGVQRRGQARGAADGSELQGSKSTAAAQNLAGGTKGAATARGDKGITQDDMEALTDTCRHPDIAIPVKLEIVIDSAGRLATPPRILRPSGINLDSPRLVAEARSIQAITDCAPFRHGAPAFGLKTYRFVFAPRS